MDVCFWWRTTCIRYVQQVGLFKVIQQAVAASVHKNFRGKVKMKIRLLPLVVAVLLTHPVLATDLELESNLVSPGSSHPWINMADCADAESQNSLELRASWSKPAAIQAWVGTLDADVFISQNDNCSSVSYEIGKAKEIGPDFTVDESKLNSEIKFPELDVDTYTLADLMDDSGLDCSSEIENDYYLCLAFDYTYTNYTGNEITDRYYGGAPIRIDTKAPQTPTLTKVDAGEKNLKITWEAPEDEDLGGFYVYYRPKGGTDSDWQYKTAAGGSVTSYQLEGLENFKTYEIAISAYDLADNEGNASESLTGTPTPIEDFYEYYRGQAEGSETGGFCFVATAAYGSYDNAMVLKLRALRDNVLLHSAAGRSFVSSYYRLGPRWARAIRGHDTSRSFARWSLLPLAGIWSLHGAGIGEWMVLLMAISLLVWLGVHFRRWLASLVSRAGPLVLALVMGLSLSMVGTKAFASERDSLDLPDDMIVEQPQYELQVRLGSYLPSIDSEAGLQGTPFKDIFGNSSEILFELALDREIWRGFGVVTAGASFGFVQYLGKGRTQSGTVASDTTVLNLLPLRLSVGYHFTLLDDLWEIPLVPYVNGGLSYYIWWVTDGVGDVASWQNENGDTNDAMGGIFGLHVGVGLKLLLDWMDKGAAASIQNDIGVLNTFLFAEYNYSWVDGFGTGDHMSLGDDTLMFGLMFEF